MADLVVNFFHVGQVHANHQGSEVMVDGRLDRVCQEILGHPVTDGAVGGLDLAEHDASVADRLVDKGHLEVDVVNAGLNPLDYGLTTHLRLNFGHA